VLSSRGQLEVSRYVSVHASQCVGLLMGCVCVSSNVFLNKKGDLEKHLPPSVNALAC
jgi:hypothetical protein